MPASLEGDERPLVHEYGCAAQGRLHIPTRIPAQVDDEALRALLLDKGDRLLQTPDDRWRKAIDPDAGFCSSVLFEMNKRGRQSIPFG